VSHGLLIIIIFRLNQSGSFAGHLILPCVRKNTCVLYFLQIIMVPQPPLWSMKCYR